MRPLPIVIDFSQLLAALVMIKDHSVALSLFRRMCVLSIPVDVLTFSTVINYCLFSTCRFPILLVDRVIEYNPGVSAVAIKNVTINDNFFPDIFQKGQSCPASSWLR